MTRDGKPQMQDAEYVEDQPHQGLKRAAGGPVGPRFATNGSQVKRLRPTYAPVAVPRTAAAPMPLNAWPGAGGDNRHHGWVKSYNAAKGFGFIESAAVEGDIYFQRANLPGSVQLLNIMGRQVSLE